MWSYSDPLFSFLLLMNGLLASGFLLLLSLIVRALEVRVKYLSLICIAINEKNIVLYTIIHTFRPDEVRVFFYFLVLFLHREL